MPSCEYQYYFPSHFFMYPKRRMLWKADEGMSREGDRTGERSGRATHWLRGIILISLLLRRLKNGLWRIGAAAVPRIGVVGVVVLLI